MSESSRQPARTSAYADHVALVTGGGRGLGRSIATGLARGGAAVVVVARSKDQTEETVDLISRSGGTAVPLEADVSDTDRLADLTKRVHGLFGPVDILVNNAATVTPLGPTVDVSLQDMAAAFALNVFAPTALAAAVLPQMLSRSWGRIVNVSSGVVAHPTFMVGGNIYTATKSALEAHTLNLAAELAGTGVTANVYRPGMVDTAMQEFIRSQDPDRIVGGLVEQFRRTYADGTLITPDQSAQSLLTHLTSPDNGVVWNYYNATTSQEGN